MVQSCQSYYFFQLCQNDREGFSSFTDITQQCQLLLELAGLTISLPAETGAASICHWPLNYAVRVESCLGKMKADGQRHVEKTR